MTVAKSHSGDPNCLGFHRAAPLSPFLLVMIITVIMVDARRLPSQDDLALYDLGGLADDTPP